MLGKNTHCPFLSGGTVPEDTMKMCPIYLALLGVTQLLQLKGKLLGIQHCSEDGLKPGAALLSPCVCARESNGSSAGPGTQN